jgi:drug/metabolite transporter (DMT)-like permease
MAVYLHFSPSRIRFYITQVLENWKFLVMMGFLQTFVMYALYYTALDFVDASISSIIMGTSPLWAALTAHFMTSDDRLSLKKVFAILLGVSGLIVTGVSRGVEGSFGWMQIAGAFMFIAAMTCSAVSNVLVKVRKELDPFVVNSFQLMFGGFLLIILAFVFEKPLESGFTAKYWGVYGWLSFVSAAAFSIWYFLLQKPGVKVSELNFWKFLIPVFGPVLSWLVVEGDDFSAGALAGMIIVALAVIYYFLPPLKSLKFFPKKRGSRSDSCDDSEVS